MKTKQLTKHFLLQKMLKVLDIFENIHTVTYFFLEKYLLVLK